MSFDLSVQWFDDGEEMRVPVQGVTMTFGDAVTSHERTRFVVFYGPSDNCEVFLAPDEHGRVAGFTIHRPCAALGLWNAIAQLLQSRHAVCFWPGSMPVIGVPDASAHVPASMQASLGVPRAVSSGAELRALVTQGARPSP
jgi:hypothetical protein